MNINKRFIRSIYWSAPTPFGAIDLERQELIFSSRLIDQLLGYSKKEMAEYAKDQFESIMHPGDKVKNRELLEAVRKSREGEVIRSTLRVKAKDGSYKYLQVNDMVYERDQKGTPLKFSTIIEDVTREAELERKLGEACKLISKIKYKNSHELRAPVAAIIGIVNLLEPEHFHNEYQHELFNHLANAVQRLDGIIHEINAY